MEAKKVITYSLLDGGKRSDQFYVDLPPFADKVLAEGEDRAGKLAATYQIFLEETGREKVRPKAEYLYEFLALGVLWRVYGSAATELAKVPQLLLSWLGRVRKKSKLFKPLVDFLRGVFATLFIPLAKPDSDKIPAPTLRHFNHLVNWLDASGDYKQEVKRLIVWRDYLGTLGTNEVKEVLKTAIAYAAWFEGSSLEALGDYTPEVDNFLSETHPNYRWREDRVFCGRLRVEYHLTMVGAEIMNQNNREQFLSAEKKLVIVPPCMIENLSDCEAIATSWGEKCQACTPGCRVNQVTKLGEKYGFDVLIMGDDLSVYADGSEEKENKQDSGLGVVGVSCPLTIVSGHWQTRDLGIPVQGVLLDLCGCPWHWALDERVVTDLNFKELLRTMEIER